MITTPPISPTIQDTKKTKCSSMGGAFCNLLWKELLESRDLIYPGLVIFWILPAILELVSYGTITYFSFYMMKPWALAQALWLVAGWIYALVVGCYTICRDFGRPQEHFLLAQPVSPRLVVAAKYLAGLIVLILVGSFGYLWDFCLLHLGWLVEINLYSPLLERTNLVMGIVPEAPILFLFLAYWACAFAYTAAFAIAVVTRQMVTSALLAILMLLIWIVAPLISKTFGRITMFSIYSPHSSLFLLYYLIILLLCCLAGAFILATRENALRLGRKQLAWIIAIVIVGLFSLSMREVGNSLSVRSQMRLGDGTRVYHWKKIDTCRDQVYAVQAKGPGLPIQFIKFRVDDNGNMVDQVQTDLMNQIMDDNSENKYIEDFSLNEQGNLVLRMATTKPMFTPNGDYYSQLQEIKISTLTWPEGKELELLFTKSFHLPALTHEVTNHSFSKNYLYVIAAPIEEKAPTTFYIYDLSGGSEPKYIVPMPFRITLMNIHEEVLYFSTNQETEYFNFNANKPELLLDPKNRVKKNTYYSSLEPGTYYYSDLCGLSVEHVVKGQLPEYKRAIWSSPLAFLTSGGWSDSITPKPISSSTLISTWKNGFIAYDISDPLEPQEIGFFRTYGEHTIYASVNSGQWTTSYKSQIKAVGPFIILREGDLYTVLDRPK